MGALIFLQSMTQNSYYQQAPLLRGEVPLLFAGLSHGRIFKVFIERKG